MSGSTFDGVQLVPLWFGMFVAGVYGAATGSFLGVCAWRLPRDESIILPRSRCPECGTFLRVQDLVPLVSFLIRGRCCRYCGTPMSWRYFGLELVTAVYFVFCYWRFGWGVDFVACALFGAVLIAVFLIDLEHWIIPDELILFGIIVGIARDVIGIVVGDRGMMAIPIPWTSVTLPVPQSIVGGFICGSIFLVVAVVSLHVFKKEGLGRGDVKLAAAIGVNLPVASALLSFFFAVFLGGIIGIALIALRRKTRRDYVPFGPMMVVGAMIGMFYGGEILSAWVRYAVF